MRRPVLEAMREYRRSEFFAKRTGMPEPQALELLGAVLRKLHGFHGRELPRSTLVALLREARVPQPAKFLEAMRWHGFLEDSDLAKRKGFRVDIAPERLCVVKPPPAPGSAERKLRKAFDAWFDYLYKQAGIERDWRLF